MTLCADDGDLNKKEKQYVNPAAARPWNANSSTVPSATSLVPMSLSTCRNLRIAMAPPAGQAVVPRPLPYIAVTRNIG